MMAIEKTEMILGTRNHGKIAEFRSLFKGMQIKLLSFYDFPDVPPVEEDGKTFQDNATKKAKAIAKATGRTAVSDDSGLEVDFLNAVPGVYSARFAGERATDRDNARKARRRAVGRESREVRLRDLCGHAERENRKRRGDLHRDNQLRDARVSRIRL
jgi:XTP/dITP diphosphohydrolase